jgi:hypothetical protein
MTAACPTFDQIENRTESTLALVIWAKRASDTTLAVVAGNMLLALLSHYLRRLDEVLSTKVLEQFSNEQLADLATKLKELLSRLVPLCSRIESSHAQKFLLPHLVSRVCKSTEDLESTLENISFALRPEFRDVISAAIDKLGLKAEAREVMSHQS